MLRNHHGLRDAGDLTAATAETTVGTCDPPSTRLFLSHNPREQRRQQVLRRPRHAEAAGRTALCSYGAPGVRGKHTAAGCHVRRPIWRSATWRCTVNAPDSRSARRPARTAFFGAGLTHQVIVMCLAFTATLIAVLVVMMAMTANLDERVRSARGAQQALSDAGRLEGSLLAVESSERGFIITRDQRFMQSWERARAAIPQQAAQLAVSSAGNPSLRVLVQHLNGQIAAYLNEDSVPSMRAYLAGGAGPDDARLLDTQSRLDAIHAGFAQFSTMQTRDAARQAAAEHADIVWARAVAVTGLTGSIVVVVSFAVFVNRRIVRPVRAAAGTADDLASRTLSARMPEDGPGEVGVLQRSFNAMAVSLEDQHHRLGRLVSEQSALRRIATLVACGTPPDAVFTAIAEEVGWLLRAEATMLLRFEPDGLATVVAAWGRGDPPAVIGTRTALHPHGVAAHVYAEQRPWLAAVGDGTPLTDPFLTEHRITTSVGAPIMVQGISWGALVVLARDKEHLRTEDVARTADFTDLAGVAVANLQARCDLAAASVRIADVGDEARRRIERDLHDGTQQRLLALLLDLRRIQKQASTGLADVPAELATTSADLACALDELRELSHGIHPAILTERGLGAALRTLARRSSVPTELDIRLQGRLPASIETNAYYIIAEAVTNAVKHANASYIRIVVVSDEHTLRICVEDDGVGGAEPSAGSGIRGLSDRIAALGGSSRLISLPGHGTTLQGTIPLPERPAPQTRTGQAAPAVHSGRAASRLKTTADLAMPSDAAAT
ncbi:CHASE3 domain-containing protein [Dactylosporangium sp. NPDC005555]|uniref:CHASE3 domain-containing protein n=1 Tax=Dactylosporangium sp. NPDC005555 TaxID=3154889 RepID=UPI0033A42A97